MLTIRKQNFESQLCYCCTGIKANICDPGSSLVYKLYHKLPDESRHIQAQVVVPRCKKCAEKMTPIIPIAIIGGIFGCLGGFFYTFSSHGFIISLICGLCWGAVVLVGMLNVLNFAFSIVYNQMESDYEIVSVLRDKYGWQTYKPQEGDSDSSVTVNKFNAMLEDIVVNYDCEYGEM
ncbi:MAG: hypothetical protein Q4C30_00110 [Bacteroidia bacterium]|nr:hypothetical protein [Bacteroidia bacterium]